MTAPIADEEKRHIHYCKDYREASTCTTRGYCECECGARSPLPPTAGGWVKTDAKEATT